MSDYFLAHSLVAFRNSINVAFPRRDKSSDGWIGDASHAARSSEHNPCWTCTGQQYGIVRAIDVDIDDNDANRDLRKMVLNTAIGHRAVWYVISNGIIYSRTNGWKALKYKGTNGHFHHVHVSILKTLAAAKDTSLLLPMATVKPPSAGGGSVVVPAFTISMATMQQAAKGMVLVPGTWQYNDVDAFYAWAVRLTESGGTFIASDGTRAVWQRAIRQKNYRGAGAQLQATIRRFQQRYHLVADGIFGPSSAAIMKHDHFAIKP